MSSQVYKTSRASIRPSAVNQRYAYVLDSQNPEAILADEMRDFFATMGYSEIYPNFDSIRIGSIHPFSILLAQEVLDQPRKVNVFPAVTIADSSTEEDVEALANDYEALVFTASDVAKLEGYRAAGDVFVSDTGWAAIQNKANADGKIIGIKRSYQTRHSIDFNIWTENKDITSFLFDMVSHFVVQKRTDLHNKYGIDLGRLSGRRTGDINLDFGMLLYGANVQALADMPHEAVLFDISLTTIDQIDTGTLPEYFSLQ